MSTFLGDSRQLPEVAFQFQEGVKEDDEIWLDYLKTAEDSDKRMIDDWTRVVDSILVFIALFIAILTTFIIDTSKKFQADPAVASAQLLAQIYLQLHDSSTPFVDPNQFLLVDHKQRSNAILNNFLLYTSLALSINVAAAACAAKLWLIRYNRLIAASGPPYERAMRRHRAYTGLVEWKLEGIIEALPVVIIVAVTLFGLFIHSSTAEKLRILGYVVGILLLLGLAFIVVLSVAGAFIPNSPFVSSFSDFLRLIYRVFPPYSNAARYEDKIPILNYRDSSILAASIGGAALTAFLVRRTGSAAFHGLFLIPITSMFALLRRPKEREDMKPRIFGLPQMTLIGTFIVALPLSYSAYVSNRLRSYIISYSVTCVLLAIVGICGWRLSRFAPKTSETEAAAWMITRYGTRKRDWFKKAVEMSRNSKTSKEMLLEKIFPLLVPLIANAQHKAGHEPFPPDQDIYTYVACLRELCPPPLMDSQTKKPTFWSRLWKNEVAFRCPDLSPELATTLRDIRNCEICGSGLKGISELAKEILDSLPVVAGASWKTYQDFA